MTTLVVVFLGVLVTGIFASLRRTHAHEGARWKDAAAALGLDLEQRALPWGATEEVMVGVRGTVPVEVRATDAGSELRVLARAMLAHPLHAGLFASTERGAPGDREDAGPAWLDVPALAQWSVRAADPARARALLRAAAAALEAARAGGTFVLVDDEWAAVGRVFRGAPEEVYEIVDAAIALQRALARARQAAGASLAERAAQAAWKDGPSGLARDPSGTRLTGERELFGVSISLEYAQGQAGTHAVFRLRTPVAGIARLGPPGPAAPGSPTGDAAFDARFALATPDAAARAMLGEDARGALLELPPAIRRVVVGGARIELRADGVLDAPAIAEVLRVTERLVRLLASSGMYR